MFLPPLPIPIQRLRICHTGRDPNIPPRQNLLYGDFDLLLVSRKRDLGTRLNERRHMSATELLRNNLLNLCLQSCRELMARSHKQEENHCLIGICSPSPPDAERVAYGDWEVGEEDIIDFCAAEADAGGLEESVAAAEHEKSTGRRGDLDEVAVVPDAGEGGEVGALVGGGAVGAPEGNGLA